MYDVLLEVTGTSTGTSYLFTEEAASCNLLRKNVPLRIQALWPPMEALVPSVRHNSRNWSIFSAYPGAVEGRFQAKKPWSAYAKGSQRIAENSVD